jgi:uridylate kinase
LPQAFFCIYCETETVVASCRFSRILLKLSGEGLMSGSDPFGHVKLESIASVIAQVSASGVEVGVVVGAGNLFRARSANLEVMPRVSADNVGMLATIMNATVLRDYIRKAGQKAEVLTPKEMPPLTKTFSQDLSLELLKDNTVLIFGGGTGNPYFTTDSAAALRALEINADVLLKATQVDGVYNKDPHKFSDAIRYDSLAFSEVIDNRLKVMDLTAVALCEENNLPIEVFDITDPNNLLRVLSGDLKGTIVSKETQS